MTLTELLQQLKDLLEQLPTAQLQAPTDFFNAVAHLVNISLNEGQSMSIIISRRNGSFRVVACDMHGEIVDGYADTIDDALAAFGKNGAP